MDRKEQVFQADTASLSEVLAFVDMFLEGAGCSMKAQMQIDIAMEEMFVNVARYAYKDSSGGQVSVSVIEEEEPHRILVELSDEGIPFDPTARTDPDITLSLEEREIGGLGIYMAKKNMDGMTYEYRDGRNVLRMWKNLA